MAPKHPTKPWGPRRIFFSFFIIARRPAVEVRHLLARGPHALPRLLTDPSGRRTERRPWLGSVASPGSHRNAVLEAQLHMLNHTLGKETRKKTKKKGGGPLHNYLASGLKCILPTVDLGFCSGIIRTGLAPIGFQGLSFPPGQSGSRGDVHRESLEHFCSVPAAWPTLACLTCYITYSLKQLANSF
ncbi:hypothetical protein LX36DRAFT_310252 [Colletotrichum falcatum]|nr:hypothetical protein LX36DRAFT_310252 [Colletotrichum falcatum]